MELDIAFAGSCDNCFASPASRNEGIIKELRALAALADKGSHRRIAYSAAARAIEGVDFPIEEERSRRPKISHVGDKIWALIDEYYDSGGTIHTVRRQLEKTRQAREAFMRVAGIGEAKADELIKSGIGSIEDLRVAVAAGRVKLTAMQTEALRWYEDLQRRIPRAEVEIIAADCCKLLGCTNPPVIVGSYRRGAADSGDVDMILPMSARDTTSPAAIRDGGGIVLSSGPSRLTFLWRVWVYMRQVDILYVPPEEMGAAMLYFTGSWDFNESMRRLAKSRGLRLNQTGLYNIGAGKSLHKIASKTEADIFAALGLEYLPPEKREGAVYG